MEDPIVAEPKIAVAEWITAIGFEIIVSIGIAIGLALLMRLLFVRHPQARWITHLLPWRGAVALTMLYVSPLLLISSMLSSPWDSFFNALMNQGGLESLGWFCIGVWCSLLAFMMTATVFVQHWLPDSLPNQIARTLRTLAVVIVTLVIEVQMQTVLGDGVGGELIKAYAEFNLAGAAAAWRRIVITVFSVDILFGAIQIAVRIVVQRASSVRASSLDNAGAIAG